MTDSYQHRPHVRLHARRKPRTVQEHAGDSFSGRLAILITNRVATMTCAAVFAILAFIALPSALHAGIFATVQWLSQTFIQLVMLSIIMVGQKLLGRAGDERADATYKDAELVLHEAQEIQRHLALQDAHLERLVSALTTQVKE